MPRAEGVSTSATPAVVIDNGSGVLKAGMAGDDEPKVLFAPESVAGHSPFTNGVVSDWDAMESCWEQAFAKLGVGSEGCNMMVTAPLFDTKENKERLMQTMFETFGAPGVWTCAPAVFELYAAGRENGVVVGCGAQCSYAVLVHEGLPDPRTQVRSNVAGNALTAHAATILQQCAAEGKGGGASSIDVATAKRAKEVLAICAEGHSGRPPTDTKDSTYELPDGRKIKVDATRRAAMAEP